MAGRLQLRRGTTLQNEAFTGAVGEPTLDTETGLIHIHDGQTQGGKEFIDPVVAFQVPTADNNYTWYRLYASGWVEQGGRMFHGTGATVTVTLPVPMADGNYSWTLGFSYNNSSGYIQWNHGSIWNRTATGFSIQCAENADKVWEVKGMAAQGA